MVVLVLINDNILRVRVKEIIELYLFLFAYFRVIVPDLCNTYLLISLFIILLGQQILKNLVCLKLRPNLHSTMLLLIYQIYVFIHLFSIRYVFRICFLSGTPIICCTVQR